MPIRNYVIGEVPYLKKYEPFSTQANVVSVDYIGQMVSYDLQPQEVPTNIDYYTGASGSYVNVLTLKNLTQNVTLAGIIEFNNEILIVHEVDLYADTLEKLEFTLAPTQIRQFVIKTKNKFLNNKVIYSTIDANIKVTIQNVMNDSLALKNADTFILPIKSFPTNITVK